eukprot:scaffold311769_cov32-Tisochrysis_lutea.AAC.1
MSSPSKLVLAGWLSRRAPCDGSSAPHESGSGSGVLAGTEECPGSSGKSFAPGLRRSFHEVNERGIGGLGRARRAAAAARLVREGREWSCAR